MSINRRILLMFMFFVLAVSCEKPDIENPSDGDEPGSEIITPDPTPDPPSDPEVFDGRVRRLRAATNGKGLDIVIMGDGFTEQDIKDGTYDAEMERACIYMFSVQPVSALESYFNVWSVAVASENNKLDGSSGLKCKGVNPSADTEKIVDSYGSKVDSIVVDSTVFCIVINSKEHGGWTTHHSYKTQKSYAFCPMIESTPRNQYYRLAVVHETMGHGFAKLGDEYVMSGYEKATPSVKDRSDLISSHNYGYDLNITYSQNEETCPWKDFLNDERYKAELIGFYEGVGYFGKGAYHPTKTNLMNTTWGAKSEFNAPSRRVIYNRVIGRGEGRTPDYEEFVAFDLSNQ